MGNWIIRWVVSGLALAIVANLGIGVHYDNITSLAVATIVIGLVNSLIRPILVLLTLPLTCVTFGLFGFILNAILFYAAGNAVTGFHVDTLLGAVVGPILMGLLSGAMNLILVDRKEKED
jgi:putative membrane protein